MIEVPVGQHDRRRSVSPEAALHRVQQRPLEARYPGVDQHPGTPWRTEVRDVHDREPLVCEVLCHLVQPTLAFPADDGVSTHRHLLSHADSGLHQPCPRGPGRCLVP